MIANAAFQDPGSAPGLAAGWTLRSSCAREAIAPFAPADASETFERWTPWEAALTAASLAPFAPRGTIEQFEAWPNPLFALVMSPGLVDRTVTDGFEAGWWQGAASFGWSDVPAVVGIWMGGVKAEAFDGWRAGAPYILAFAPAALLAAPLTGSGSLELFTAWTTKNTTLG